MGNTKRDGPGSEVDVLPQWQTEREKRREHFGDALSSSRTEWYDILKNYDETMIKGWNDEIDALLLFVS